MQNITGVWDKEFKNGPSDNFEGSLPKIISLSENNSCQGDLLNVFINPLMHNVRSSRWQMFFTIAVLKKIVNFTGKNLCGILFLINFLSKRDSSTGVFL